MERIQRLYRNKIKVVSVLSPLKSECPVCGFLARDRTDITSIKEEKACTECVINFRDVMSKEWNKGERPTESVARSRMNIFIDEV